MNSVGQINQTILLETIYCMGIGLVAAANLGVCGSYIFSVPGKLSKQVTEHD